MLSDLDTLNVFLSQYVPAKPAWVNRWFNLFNTEKCQQPYPNWKKKKSEEGPEVSDTRCSEF